MSLSKYISEKELINGNTFLLASIFGRTKNSSSQKDRICSMPNFDFIFILGSTNFQVSALTDHTTQADVTTQQFMKKNMKKLL